MLCKKTTVVNQATEKQMRPEDLGGQVNQQIPLYLTLCVPTRCEVC